MFFPEMHLPNWALLPSWTIGALPPPPLFFFFSLFSSSLFPPRALYLLSRYIRHHYIDFWLLSYTVSEYFVITSFSY